MSGSPSLAATRSARRRRLHPLRHTESDRDLAYLIRTPLRFQRNERGSARRLHRRRPVARSQDLVQSAPAVPAAGRRRWIRCTPRREGYKLSANYVAGRQLARPARKRSAVGPRRTNRKYRGANRSHHAGDAISLICRSRSTLRRSRCRSGHLTITRSEVHCPNCVRFS